MMLNSDLFQQLLAQATLATAAARALEHCVALPHRAPANEWRMRAAAPAPVGWIASITALVYGLSIRGDAVLLAGAAIQVVMLTIALTRSSAGRPAAASKFTALDSTHE